MATDPSLATQGDAVLQRLVALGLALPEPPPPLGAYRAVIEAAGLLHVSMQGPVVAGHPLPRGLLGAELTLEEGRQAARLAVLNALAQVRLHLGGFQRVRQVVRLEGHVACVQSFTQHPQVLDGASELLASLFDTRAGHARSVCGVRNLPGNLPVAVTLTLEVEPSRR